MSIIYDALRTGQPSASLAARAGARIALVQRVSPYALCLAAGVVLAGPAGYLVARNVKATPVAEEAPAATTHPTARPVAPATVASVTPEVRPAKRPSSAPATTLAVMHGNLTTSDTAATDSEVSGTGTTRTAGNHARASATAATTTAATGALQDHSEIKIDVRTPALASKADSSPMSDKEPDPVVVRAHMAQLHEAVADADSHAAEQALQQLQGILPAGSLTLLRARAWAAHAQGDANAAEQYYAAILARVPDDEHAGVNLALIEARRGAAEDARSRLNRLAARNIRSPLVNRALQEMELASQ